MQKKKMFVLAGLAAMMLMLAACGTANPATVEVPREVKETVVVEPTADPNAAAPLPAGSVQINGAGATFPLPVYSAWTFAYKYVDPSVVINYQGIGSGGGKKAIIEGTVDFAGSDSLLKDEEYASGKDLQMYPMLAGAVVTVYNIKWAKEVESGTKLPVLVLDRQTLVDIYNAKVTMWNDPKILATNAGLADYLPAAAITAVHRSDGSGTTEIFTKALTAFSSEWTAGGASAIEWPVDKDGNGMGGKGNQGVAAAVINTPNSIGYVELSYAVSNGMSFASLVNKSGNVVVANAETLGNAMSDFAGAFSDKLTATIVDAPGAASWPIAGYTYIILHTQSMTDCVKAEKLLGFLTWALTDPGAAQQASDLGYSVLPTDVRDIVLAKLGEVTCNSNPVL
ncbi:MAG: phosphate ABC transporter substrate-binding protein PstS [Anaerolineales bacterium]|nr:phosphate ABC transporter substrate-binding protein PstS [Anaerolineales bacterium]